MTQRRPDGRLRADWEADALRDDIGRLDGVARVLTGRALSRDIEDLDLLAAVNTIDRVLRDLARIVREIDATTETRSAA